MKTKLYILAIAVLGIIKVGNAQAQNQECMTNLSIFSEHAKVKNYDAAYTPWKMVYETCPDLNWATYAYGERILKDKIKKTSGEEQKGFVKDLITLYDGRMKYYASKTSKAETMVDKVLVMNDHKMISKQETFDNLHQAMMEDGANFKDPKALYLNFSSLVDLYNENKADLQQVFDEYDNSNEVIERENKSLTDKIAPLLVKEEAETLTSKEKRLLKSYNSYSAAYGKIAGSIDTKLGRLADCQNLIPLYQKSFDAKKNDVTWVKRAVGRMFSKDCTDDPMFKKLFEAQLALDPSPEAYVYGALLKQKSGDNKGAIADFNKAVELQSDSYKKSDLLYKIATIYRKSGSKSTARNYAQKAISANGSNGKAYLLIANLYASSANACGTTAFEKRAIYWKAAEMARKAGRVDPSLSGRAKKSAASYAAKAPSKEMIFSSGMAGKTVTFSCWVGGSVKVPNL